MSKFITRLLLSCLLIGLTALPSFAQNKQALQEKKKKLQQEINFTNQLLEKTEKSKYTSLNQLRQLNKKISSRQALISTMEQEIQFIADSIDLQNNFIDSLNNELETLKDEYAEMIRNAYRNKSSYDKLMFIFSAENFNQAFKRLKYFQQYAQYRQAQAQTIEETQIEIDAQIKLLEAIKKSNEALLQAKLNERNTLAQEKSKQQIVVNTLNGKERQLKNQLKEKQEASRKITKAIERIIAEEIRKAREAARKAGEKDKGFPLTPEARELSNSFASNKGKLPWPVPEGVITSAYGVHPHPTLKAVKTTNNGIDISTKSGNMGRSVFNGSVTSVFIIPGAGKGVIISHGEYFTTYSPFKEVFVSTNDKVETKQNLGVLITEKGENSSVMHLEIWKVMDKLDPESWIFKK